MLTARSDSDSFLSPTRIGISVDINYAPYSANRAYEILIDHFPDTNLAVEFFSQGVDYIKNGLPGNATDLALHEIKIKELVAHFFLIYDGLIVPGNNTNINSSFYSGDDAKVRSIPLSDADNRRTWLEIALVRGALERGIPVLGLCGGNQVINVVLGGKLKTVIDLNETLLAYAHLDYNDVIYLQNRHLHSIVTRNKPTPQNSDIVASEFSCHEQAIDSQSLPYALLTAAINQQNIIKAVEIKGHHPWVIGTQFHPEANESAYNLPLFRDFIKTCGAVKKVKKQKAAMAAEILHGRNTLSGRRRIIDNLFLLIDQLTLAGDNVAAIIHDLIIHTNSIATLYFVLERLPAAFCFEYAVACKEKIKNTHDLAGVLSRLPENNRAQFTALLPEKISNGHELTQIMQVLPPDDQLVFASSRNDVLTNGDELRPVLEQLPATLRLKFAISFLHRILNARELGAVLATLSKEEQLQFVRMNKDKVLGINDMEILLSQLPENNRLDLAIFFKDKISNAVYLRIVLYRLPHEEKMEFAKSFTHVINTVNDILLVISVVPKDLRVDFILLHKDKILKMDRSRKDLLYSLLDALDGDAEKSLFAYIFKDLIKAFMPNTDNFSPAFFSRYSPVQTVLTAAPAHQSAPGK